MRRFRRLHIGLLGLGALAPLAACEVVAGLTRAESVEAALDGGTEASAGDGAPTGLDPCGPRPPERKPGDLPQLETITFAVRWVETPVPSKVPKDPDRLCPNAAFDLDEVATCFPLQDGAFAPSSCKEWTPKQKCDDTLEGRDNSGLAATGPLTGISGPSDDDPNPSFEKGSAGLLLELAGYNGTPDDAQISVSAIFARGVEDAADAGEPTGTAKWDGNDVWIGDPGSFLGEDQPRYTTSNAHVIGDILVAQFTNTPFPSFGGSGTQLQARSLLVTAKLVRDGQGRAKGLDFGRIGSTVAVSTVLNYFGTRSISGELLCDPQTGYRETLLERVCEAADLGPRGTAPAGCDAISYGAGFYAERAKRQRLPYKTPLDAGPPLECPFQPWPITCAEAAEAGLL